MYYIAAAGSYSSQTCGATHLHLPPTMCATKGLAGRLEMEPISGQMPVGHLSGRDRARPEEFVGVAFCMLFIQRGRDAKLQRELI